MSTNHHFYYWWPQSCYKVNSVTFPFFFWTGSTPKTPEWYIPGNLTSFVFFPLCCRVVCTQYILSGLLHCYCNACFIPEKIMTDRIGYWESSKCRALTLPSVKLRFLNKFRKIKDLYFRIHFLLMWYFFCVDEIGIHGPPLVVDGAELWFVPDKNLSYQEAISYCQKNDSDLASVESYPKLRTILSQIEKVRGCNLFSQLLSLAGEFTCQVFQYKKMLILISFFFLLAWMVFNCT